MKTWRYSRLWWMQVRIWTWPQMKATQSWVF
jgi:hypothetical protein